MKSGFYCLLCLVIFVAPAFSIDLSQTAQVGGETGDAVASFCDVPGQVKDECPPDFVNGLANSECFSGVALVETADSFTGDGQLLTGIGWYQQWSAGKPAAPVFNIRIYVRAANGCPDDGQMVYSATVSVLSDNGGSGSIADPTEYFADLATNGVADFLKEDGVEYMISIVSNNCPGEGTAAFWASGQCDGDYGCISAPDFGIPRWSHMADFGYAWDCAMYLCNEGAGTPIQDATWSEVKASYR